jgi:hypothetical protein
VDEIDSIEASVSGFPPGRVICNVSLDGQLLEAEETKEGDAGTETKNSMVIIKATETFLEVVPRKVIGGIRP